MAGKADAAPDVETGDEIFSRLQEDFNASGMTDEELGKLIDEEIKAYRAEKRANSHIN